MPSSTCSVPGCQPHRKYSKDSSSTAQAITNEQGEGSSEITFGTGQISGDFYKDKLCIGDSLCSDAGFIAATQETDEPFETIPFDGILGMGFKDLSMGNGFNIVDNMNDANQLPGGQFSFFLDDDDGSEVTFGGYKQEHLASDIVWADVKVPSWWQVAVDDITFDDQPKNLCAGGGCQVAVDTGTSMLAGPSDLIEKISAQVGAKDDCSNFASLPKIGFQINNKVLNLKPEDYMDKGSGGCSMSFMDLDVPPPKGPVFVFGDPFLRRFVTIYDRNEPPRVGFAVANHGGENAADFISSVGGGSGNPGVPPASSASGVNLHLQSGLMEGDSAAGESDYGTPKPSEEDAAPSEAPASDANPAKETETQEEALDHLAVDRLARADTEKAPKPTAEVESKAAESDDLVAAAENDDLAATEKSSEEGKKIGLGENQSQLRRFLFGGLQKKQRKMQKTVVGKANHRLVTVKLHRGVMGQ
jgi:saccharopepsin